MNTLTSCSLSEAGEMDQENREVGVIVRWGAGWGKGRGKVGVDERVRGV